MTAAYSPRRHHWAGWVTMGPSETLMLESRANTWYGRLGSGSRKWTRTPASSYTDTISACCFPASSGLKVRPLSRVARAMELAGSQWKLSGGHRRTSRRRPYSESTPQAGSARVVASIVGYHLLSWVAGWVTNRPDGAVEAVFEGSPDAVATMVDFCESGPRGADVHRVETSDEEPEGLSGFDVRWASSPFRHTRDPPVARRLL